MKRKQFLPRKWQEDCRIEFFNSGKNRFSIGAVPGAGKSKAAAWIMSSLMDRGDIDLIIAVSPQGNKKQEWYEDFSQFFGIWLDTRYSSSSVFKHNKFKGAILTYQGINKNLYRDIQTLCKTYKVGVIADEPHHLSESDESKWGTYFRQAFAEAKYMVFLSGTYWREDKTPIPFIERDEHTGQYVIDYQYSYSDSLLDGNSRKMEFEFYDPEIKYEDASNGDYYEGKLSDIDARLIDRCYRKLVLEKNSDLKSVLQNALVKLDQIRKTDMPDAGLIVFAPDQSTAEELQNWLYTDDFGFIQSRVAVSDNKESSEEIAFFKKSDELVLIAVNMVSEGIDIPRLRVGVYLSIYKTFLYFMQSIVGRLIRVTQNEYLSYQTGQMKRPNFSHAFILKHPTLFDFSQRVEDEMYEAEFRAEDSEFDDEKKPGGSDGTRADVVDFSSIEVLDIGKKEFVTAGKHLEASESEEVESIFMNAPDILNPKLESYLRMNFANLLSQQKQHIAKQAQEIVMSDPILDEERLSKQIKKWCNKIGGFLLQHTTAESSQVWQDVRFHLYSRFGSLNIKKNDIPFETLKEARDYAKELYNQLDAGVIDPQRFNNDINVWRYERKNKSSWS